MNTQLIVWTALPNGINPSTGKLRLSVFVSPRLQSDETAPTLSSFAFEDWPAHTVSFQVRVDGGGHLPVAAVITSEPADSALWKALFAPSTPITSHEPDDFSRQQIVNHYPGGKLHSYLRDSYVRLSTRSSHRLPDQRTLKEVFVDLHSAFVTPPPGEPRPPDAPPTPVAGAVAPPILRQHLQLGHIEALRPSDLNQFRLALADNLFRVSDEATLIEKIQGAVLSARRVAQASPSGTFVSVIPNAGTPASHFAQFAAFHRSPHAPSARPAIDQEPLDFHQVIASLGQYPALLRRLALVFDLECERPLGAGSTADSPGNLRVIPTVSLANTATFISSHHTPLTAYVLDDQRFFPAPALAQPGSHGATIVDGLLNLQLRDTSDPDHPPLFHIAQIDLDGAAFKAINMVSSQVRQADLPGVASVPAGDAGVAAVRTSGIWVTRADHVAALYRGFGKTLDNNEKIRQAPRVAPAQLPDTNSQLAQFVAEDLVRGYRVDIFDSTTNRWFSLHQRIGDYTFPAHVSGPLRLSGIADEGYIQHAMTQRVDDDPSQGPPPVHLHDSFFHWQGWSLSATRPGLSELSDAPAPPEVRSPVHVGFTVSGTLPRLRFGRAYKVRLRTVDLAGNSLSLEEAAAVLQSMSDRGLSLPILPDQASAEAKDFVYRRFEPVSSPPLVQCELAKEGESVERLVIRSNRDVAAGINERHVVPAKIAQQMAEAHGLLDGAFGRLPGETDAAFTARCVTTYNIAKREKGTLSDTAIVDIVTGFEVPAGDLLFVNSATGETRPDKGAGDEGVYSVHRETALKVPYLPDPLARGVAFADLPGVPPSVPAPDGSMGLMVGELDATAGLSFQPVSMPDPVRAHVRSITRIDFGPSGNWPDVLPFRLQLREPPRDAQGQSLAAAPPAWDADARVLSVQLPKGEQTTIRMSSSLLETDLDLLGIWNWLLESNVAQLQELRGRQAFAEQAREEARAEVQRRIDEQLPATSIKAAQRIAESKALLAAERRRTADEFERGLPDLVATATRQSTLGILWMLTPFRELTLVHAVQQPLVDPVITPRSLGAARRRNATSADIVGTVPVHGASTAKLDLLAEWSEPVDLGFGPVRLGNDAPVFRAHVFEVPIHLPAGDVKRDDVLLLTTPSSENNKRDIPLLPFRKDDALRSVGALPDDPAKPDPGPGAPPPPENPLTTERTFAPRHEFNDTKARRVRYQFVATSRFREYFPKSVTDDHNQITRSSPLAEIVVPNSALPAAPKVLYAIPTARWQKPGASGGPVRVRERIGGGIRVYLDRPWFSTGEGELLGVVVSGASAGLLIAETDPLVTHWGADPIFVSPPPLTGKDTPAPVHFRNIVQQDEVRLSELGQTGVVFFGDDRPGGQGPSSVPVTSGVIVLGFEVHFDVDRELWYCDVEMDVGAAYFPFVRLALVRYQPHSIIGAEISKVVIADFVQVMPDRVITITTESSQPDRVTIDVVGPTYQNTSASALTGLPPGSASVIVTVSVEERIAGATDDLGWAPTTNNAVRILQDRGTGRQLAVAQVTLPQSRVAGQFRVLIKEFEQFASDNGTGIGLTSRLVFADTLEL